MIDQVENKLIVNGYTEEKAKEMVSDMLRFIEKHSISSLEDSFHYFMETMESLGYESKHASTEA